MNIRKIKERANQLLSVDKQQYIRILMILVLLELIPTLFSTGHDILSRIIYIIISLAFIAVSHGYVVSSLKMVRNQSSLLSDDDALVGFKRFKGLFSTYLLNNIVLFFITFAAMFILMMIFGVFLSGIQLDSFANEISLSGNYTQVLLSIFSQSPSLLAAFILFYMLMIVIVFVISSYLFAVPYLLERYQMTNLMAIKESYRFMKGHIFDYIKLNLSFLGWILGLMITQMGLNRLLMFLPILGALISAIITGIIGVYTYLPRYQLSKAIFFEELAYYRYDHHQTYGGDENHV
ncbi:DUF975 family protein [Massilimicrobiota sp. An134]|uniref:DUF975 family protein n=1 Tax=Massilimicrobiota sp. An134 TaxID=1965557 RepID=UPI000B3894FE|nr:DUF975 family protein [Massilimicrobiota sp. An134]OUQ23492.1 hypothetical protein B5E79_12890 [Massilimicrobiota sp. An134]